MALNAREPETLVRNPGEGEEAQMSGPPGQGQKIRMDPMQHWRLWPCLQLGRLVCEAGSSEMAVWVPQIFCNLEKN